MSKHKFQEGDILKIFHFIGARHKKHYMYKVVGMDSAGELVAYDIPELMQLGKEKAHTCRLKYIAECCKYEVIHRVFSDDSKQVLEYSHE